MATVNGTINAVSYRNSTNSSDASVGWLSYSAQNASVGVNQNGYICTLIVKFTTPSFVGNCTELYVKVPFIKGNATTAPTSYSMHYAIASSDANKTAYVTTSAVGSNTDPYQISNGNITLSGLTTSLSENTCAKIYVNSSNSNITSIQPNTTYYLYFWPTDSTANKVVQNWWDKNYHTVKVTYSENAGGGGDSGDSGDNGGDGGDSGGNNDSGSGGVYIANSYGVLELYDIYVGDSTGKPVACDVYIYNGSQMVKC